MTDPYGDRRVLRHTVPVDELWHRIEYVGDIVHVGCKHARAVEFWTTERVIVHRVFDGLSRCVKPTTYEAVDRKPRLTFEFRIFATGQPIEDGEYVGTALALGGELVWHLFVREVPAS